MSASVSSTQNQTSPSTITHPEQQESQKIPNRRTVKKAEKPAKAVGAFRTISEVADELKVQQHVLRFWESKFGQIKPLKRGGGRRYYRPEDVELLKNIHNLLYQQGYTIKGVQKLLQSTRGNLAAKMGDALVADETAVEATPAVVIAEISSLTSAVINNRAELQAMLADLKSMRRMIG
jgi:DNA-binding transcriptional MerR regulator